MRRSAAVLLALALLAAAAAPAAAKEWLEAELDAPIAMDTPPGTEILVGVTVTVPEGQDRGPLDGSPLYVTLTGADGEVTRALATEDGPDRHYTVRIAIPAGGARDIEIGLQGETDLPMVLMADPFTFGPITAGTAQRAPAAAGAMPAEPAAPAAVPTAAGTSSPLPLAAAGLVLVAIAGVVTALVVRRRGTPDALPRSA